MCLSPITIGNRSRRFVRGLSRPLFTVPCGHCAECVSHIQDEWGVRAIFETRRVKQLGGACWVPILTYKNEDLPRYSDSEYYSAGKPFDIPCFDPTHIKRFRDRMRVYFKRHFHKYMREHYPQFYNPEIDFKGNYTIRYIACAEYGEKRGRSHYHALVYVPFFVPASFMYDCFKFAWPYGKVRYSTKGMMASDMKAAKYSMKYVTKDMAWSDTYKTDHYVAYLKKCILHCKKTNDLEGLDKYESKLKAFRRVRPRHFQSMGFGSTGIDYYKNGDGSFDEQRLVSGIIDASRIGLPPLKSGDYFKYPMPMYFARKIFYNVDEYGLYMLNTLGEKILTKRFDGSLKTKSENYEKFFDRSLFNTYTVGLDDFDGDSYYNYINSLMDGRSASSLSLFNKVYQDIEGTEDNECLISHLNENMTDDECFHLLSDNALDFLITQKTIDREPDPEGFDSRPNHIVRFGFNNLPCFRDFKSVLGVIDEIDYKVGKLKQASAEIKRQREKDLCKPDPYITNPFIYGSV